MRVEICIPAHNEAPIIAESVRVVQNAIQQFGAVVIVSDNASTDETATRATDAGARVLITRELGKGSAVIGCARGSDADVFGFIDADLSADPHHLPPFIRMITDGECDIVIGSRLLNTTVVQRSILRTISSFAFNAIRRLLLGIRVQDTQCGLKVMNGRGRTLLGVCVERGWFFDMEFLARAERSGLRIKEVPVGWNEYRFPERKSKLRILRDGWGALAAMIRIRQHLMSQ